MPKLDLGKAADFSLLTSGGLSDIGKLLGINPADWDIREASYNGVVFHVFKTNVPWNGALSRITDIGGRRKVKYVFPYRDGQTTDDLGRKPSSFELDVLIFGPNYLEAVSALEKEFAKPTPGVLVHPIRGDITCAVDDVQVIHANEMRKAAAFKITFIEHNFTIGDVSQVEDSSLKSALSLALKAFSLIDTAINKINAAIALRQGLKALVNSYAALYKFNTAKVLTAINQAFNTKGGSNDMPSLLPVNAGGTGIATSSSGGRASSNRSSTRSASLAVTAAETAKADGKSDAFAAAAASKALSSAGASLTVGSPEVATDSKFVVVRSLSDPFNGVPVADLAPTTAAALAAVQITKSVRELRTQLATMIAYIENNGGSFELFDTIQDLRETAILVQNALETGIASSNARLVAYTTPRLMSLREVAFVNGLTPERVKELDLLNQSLLSTNYIEKGTVLQVPAS